VTGQKDVVKNDGIWRILIAAVDRRVARFFVAQYTKTGQNIHLLRRMEGQIISPPGDSFTLRGQNSPLGDNFDPAVKVCP
jgi:hypothetical protein